MRTTSLLALFIPVATGAVLLFGLAGFGPGRQSAQATLLSEVKKLVASDAQADDDFGSSVAVSGDTAVVGADDENDAGAAYIYQRGQGGAGNWGEVKKLTASDAQAGDFFGASVAISGDTVVVGAYLEDDGGNNAGAAYVYKRDQGGADNWGRVSKLTASDAQASDFFGRSVGVSGDTAVVGADGEDTDGSLAGAAYLFGRDLGGADNWGEVNKVTASDAQAADFFGVSVAISGEVAVVGASGEDTGGSNAGAVYVIQRLPGDPDSWREVKKLTASDPGVFVFFGSSVAISGDTPVVGANNEATGGESAGAAYLFHRDRGGPDNWGEVKKLTASDAQASDHFGVSVAISANTAVMGADGEDAGGEDAGAAYVFEEPPPTPTPTPKPPGGDTDGDTIPNSSDPDDDNDGCTDEQELGLSATLGGRRNPHSYWDFFDTPAGTPPARDQIVNIIDIAAVVLRFGTVSDPPPTKEEALAEALMPPSDLTSYHAAFDRDSPIPGEDLWDLLPPDGAINIIDIGAVVVQFGHTCA